jgi:hypoxanthine-guanine phosphoribosyltransferase
VLISEGFLRDRIDRLAQRIYQDALDEGKEQLDLLIIMNSAFRFFTELISCLNRQSEMPG